MIVIVLYFEERRELMKFLKNLSLSIKILLALILGVGVGFLLQDSPEIATKYIEPFGILFLNMIKLTIVPLVFSSLVVGVGGMDDVTKLGKVGVKTFLYFFFTTGIAICIGLFMGNILNVGGNFVLANAGELVYEATESPPLSDTLLNIIPTNPIKAMAEGDMLQIIVFAIVFAMGVLALGKKATPLFDIFDIIAETMYKITGWIMALAPFGVFGLIAPVVAQNGPDVLLPLLKLIFVVYLACAIHIGVVYTLSVIVLGKTNPIHFYKTAFPAWATAFSTSSSAGTLPVTMKVSDDLGIDSSISAFVLPLGTTINMDGTAIYQGVCALFIAQVYGLDLTLGQQATIVMTATLASVGTAGVPGAGMIMLAMVLQSVNLPVEGIALVAGVERILDMARTSLNVLGDISAALFIDKTTRDNPTPTVESNTAGQ